MDRAQAREASIDQRELLEWFEDVADRRAPASVVQLVAHDHQARTTALRALYAAIAGHDRFGGPGWAPLEAPGLLAPTLDDVHSATPPAAFWLAISASSHPYVEMGQLVEQLERLKRYVHLDPWVNQAAAGEFRAVLSHASVQGPGDAVALAFGFLDPQGAERAASLAAAARVLDEAVTRTKLGRDGGALGLDGPRTRARSLLAAGWIERLARLAPVVLAVDNAHRAGPFSVDLVRAIAASAERVLVVLGGEPAVPGSDDDGSTGSPGAASLAGALRGVATASLNPVGLADDAPGRLAAALSGVHPSGLFTTHHARRWAATLGSTSDSVPAMLDRLAAAGWVRPLARDVFGFASDVRLHVARRQRDELVGAAALAHQEALCEAVAATTTEDDELAYVVAVAAAAANAPGPSDARWQLAATLATRGQMVGGERLGRAAAVGADRVAIAELWRASAWADPLQPTPPNPSTPNTEPASTPGMQPSPAARSELEVRAAVVRAASPATPPEHVAALLAPLVDATAGTPTAIERIAAARCLLMAGDVPAAAAAIGPEAPELLSSTALTQLDLLARLKDTPGLVARSVEVMTNLHAIAELRRAVPGSAALGHVLLARLELLERYGRLETAGDAAAIADEAVAAFRGRRTEPPTESPTEPPTDWWRARRAQAWTAARLGRPAVAAADLARLVDEQRATLAASDPLVLDTQLWLGRALLLAGRHDDAHTVLHALREARRRLHLDEHPELLLARQWHAAAKVEAGSPADAVAELEEVTALRTGSSAVDDEDHLAAQHLLGSALAAAGRWSEAIVVLDHTLARRSLVDLADAPRVLAARYSRAACLMFLDRRDEAIAELDAVIELADATSDPAQLVIKARNARGVARLMSGAWAPALFDLDVVVAHHAAQVPADDEVLLCARQQRAECLRWLGRDAESAAELDAVLTATATWPPGQPLVEAVRQQRAALTPR